MPASGKIHLTVLRLVKILYFTSYVRLFKYMVLFPKYFSVHYLQAAPRNMPDNIIQGNEKGTLTYSAVLGESVIYGLC